MKYPKQFSLQYLWMIILIVGLTGCENKQLDQQVQIQELEEQANRQTADAHIKPLLLAYVDYYQTYPEDAEMSPIYLYRGAVLYYRVGNWKASLQYLEIILREYRETEILPHVLILAGSVAANRTRDLSRAGQLFQNYLDLYPNGEYTEIAQFFFKPEDVKMRAKIAEAQDQLFDKNRPDKLNKKVAIRLLWSYVAYIRQFPEDQFTPIYAFQGARLATQVNEDIAAIELLDLIYGDYKEFDQYAEAMFLLAIQYENKIKNYLTGRHSSQFMEVKVNPRITVPRLRVIKPLEEAEKLYKEFLQKYPKHELAPHAESGLKYLGQKPNEVINNFLLTQKDSLR
ncbi:MAG: hypothetical protein GY810_29460 [Aureispira sp.]|nr:hypothetical protein [Aureispira sp.]